MSSEEHMELRRLLEENQRLRQVGRLLMAS
jgi:hypothetical protein